MRQLDITHFDILGMDMCAGLDLIGRIADYLAIFADDVAAGNPPQRHLMPLGNLVARRQGKSVQLRAFCDVDARHGNIIVRAEHDQRGIDDALAHRNYFLAQSNAGIRSWLAHTIRILHAKLNHVNSLYNKVRPDDARRVAAAAVMHDILAIKLGDRAIKGEVGLHVIDVCWGNAARFFIRSVGFVITDRLVAVACVATQHAKLAHGSPYRAKIGNCLNARDIGSKRSSARTTKTTRISNRTTDTLEGTILKTIHIGVMALCLILAGVVPQRDGTKAKKNA